jgi:murein L,D-transpeptidase YafK
MFVLAFLWAVICCPIFPAATMAQPSSSRSKNAIARIRPALEKALREKGLRFGAPVFVRVFKESKELELWLETENNFELFRTYDICSFSGYLGPKLRQGDMQSPEGFYYVPPGSMNPTSQFHLSFNIGYPNTFDRGHGRTGSAIMIHGNCVSIGCYAMTDAGIEDIYALADAALRGGQPFFRVHVFPFRMTERNMEKYSRSRWAGFWGNLKEGYDFFETAGWPPNVLVQGGRYRFED